MTVAIFTEPDAEEMVMQAIQRAYEERGVKVQIVPEHQLLGVSREEALKAVKTNTLVHFGTRLYGNESLDLAALCRS